MGSGSTVPEDPSGQSPLPGEVYCQFGQGQKKVVQKVLGLGRAMDGECVNKQVRGEVQPEPQ